MDFSTHLCRSSRTKKMAVKKRKNNFCSRDCICENCEERPNFFAQTWMELRMNSQLCDGVVHCSDNVNIKIHRAILSAASPYFKVLFTNSINRGQSEITEANVDIDSNTFSELLDYVYSGIPKVNKDNVVHLLKSADRYEFLGLIQACCLFLVQEMTVGNCISTRMLGDHYFCSNLIQKVDFFIQYNFPKIMRESSEFTALLTYEDVYDLLNNDYINVKNEEMIFQAILIWIIYNFEERNQYLYNLIKCIRLGNLMPASMGNIVNHPIFVNNPKCIRFFEDSLKAYHENTEALSNRPRISFDIVFAIGGWNGGLPTNFIETYDVQSDRWLLSPDTDIHPRAYHGVCVLKNQIYVIGGFDGKQYFNTVRRFDPVTKIWKDCACMYYNRCYVSVAIAENFIYALGGYNGRNRMNSMEKYDPESNQWYLMPPMRENRSDASAAVLNNKIYIVGGFNGEYVMRSGEVYNIQENQWSYIPDMLSPRSGVSLIAYNDILYAIGGFDGTNRLTSVEKYEPSKSPWWIKIADMYTSRSNFASVVLNECIYVIGGFNGFTTIDCVEYYNPENDKWTDASSMNLRRSALSACVIGGLPDLCHYSALTKSSNEVIEETD